MKTHTFLGLALASLVALPACTGSKQDVTEDFSDLAGLDDKSDAFSYRMKIVGSLDYGQTSDPVRYNRHPRFRAFKFAGDAGDQVDVWVRSADGDPIAWVLDDSFRVIGSNDDADGSTFDSHIQLTLPEHPSRTHYIVFRDYWLHPGMFTVELQGSPDYYSCTRDADCEKIQDGCCPHNGWVAVNTDHVDAYREALGCPEHPICPLIATPLDESMPQCNLDAGKCELVQPQDIACGGRTLNPHVCPDGWSCVGDGLAVDAPGECKKNCGGIAAFPCPDGQSCVDNPMDDCDPTMGGADCGGICEGTADCRSTGCAVGDYCSFCWGSYACIPNGAVC